MIKCVAFDLDGTIGDTLPLCMAAFRDSIERLAGVKVTDEEIIKNFGPSEEGIIKVLLKDRYKEGIREYLHSYEMLHYMSPKPFEGIIEILEYIKEKNIILGIVTGKGKDSAKITLDKYGIHKYFDVIETGSSKGPVKKERLKDIMNRYNLNPKEIIYIGDSVSDVYDAKYLNIPVYAAAWAKTANYDELQKSEPDNIFDNIESFGEYIKTIL